MALSLSAASLSFSARAPAPKMAIFKGDGEIGFQDSKQVAKSAALAAKQGEFCCARHHCILSPSRAMTPRAPAMPLSTMRA